MRWIMITLLLLNVLFAFWVWQQPSEAVGKAISAKLDKAGGEPLRFISELGTNAKPASIVVRERLQYAEVDQARLGVAGDSPAICTLIGPFAELLKGEQLLQRMRALEVEGSMRELEIPGEKGFWLYLNPEISRKAALRRLHELQAKNIDSFVIPNGDLANGISLGMFNKSGQAEKAAKSLIDKGYAVEIKSVERSYQESWVVINAQEAQKISAELWFQLLDGLPGLQQRQNFCPGVASL